MRQINGTRLGGPPIKGGGNIEMGGPNSNQLVEYVHSYDPRGWSCLHIAEGTLNCNNVTVQNNEIGPAGSDLFQQWADGISFSCRNGLIRNNMINNPTDGGIVLFGAPGTRVENNTIWVETVRSWLCISTCCLLIITCHTRRIHCLGVSTWWITIHSAGTTPALLSQITRSLADSLRGLLQHLRSRVPTMKTSSSSGSIVPMYGR